ncbi:hypothetical protein SAMD00019534_037410 [Acytostelium subglobosum LB1]|uniref:hypothetical protein n=1 Tax=Acytostelium subglobosum LB1 TaxID=1410327 RepID=UPI000644B713|nr:hypothetical protein SAMD00019534_037410 [Acytostelium subglobosum LB1]GAM20566.1 hypothetical protein SAMD00019534_037410 [Acytostelium subglobosum LB1]|eukprot:XP_012760087.1 hypothetical protein SAMD00019534_037410 [Acytostelium subglobosum LB1]
MTSTSTTSTTVTPASETVTSASETETPTETTKTKTKINTKTKIERKQYNNGDRDVGKAFFNQRKETLLDMLHEHSKCTNCWFLTSLCICNKLTPLSLRHRYITLFHHKEWTRVSNTGKLITLSSNRYYYDQQQQSQQQVQLAEGGEVAKKKKAVFGARPALNLLDPSNGNETSKLLVMGIEEDELALKQFFETCDHSRCFVLFPTQDSIDISEYIDLHREAKSTTTTTPATQTLNDDEATQDQDNDDDDDIISISDSLRDIRLDEQVLAELPQLTMIILDGTWSQAKKLAKHIPDDIKRVRLTFGDKKLKSMYNALRKQPAVDRISTLEAAVLGMKNIGESEEVCQQLIHSFRIMIDQLLLQNGNKDGVKRKTWVGDKPAVVVK